MSQLGTLIAKNHDDIETLRRLGERDYIEFTIGKKNAPQKVGDVQIELHSTDPKRNQCNLALVVDDQRTEKPRRTINEPIFFCAHGAHQPMEVVINQVGNSKVVRYLSIPKPVQQTFASPPSHRQTLLPVQPVPKEANFCLDRISGGRSRVFSSQERCFAPNGCSKSNLFGRYAVTRIANHEEENVKLKRLVAELSLEKQILKDVASGNL